MVESEEVESSVGLENCWWKKRWVVGVLVILMAVSILLANRDDSDELERLEASQHLQSQGYIVGVKKFGYEWFQRLTEGLHLQKHERTVSFQCIILGLPDHDLSDDDWVALRKLKYLKNLVFSGREWVDKEINSLEYWPDVIRLDLWSVNVTDQALRDLADMNDLRYLSISNAGITDDKLRFLSGLQIESLGLSDNPLTDAGLVRLASLADLKELRLKGTGVTREKVEELMPWVEDLVMDEVE